MAMDEKHYGREHRGGGRDGAKVSEGPGGVPRGEGGGDVPDMHGDRTDTLGIVYVRTDAGDGGWESRGTTATPLEGSRWCG